MNQVQRHHGTFPEFSTSSPTIGASTEMFEATEQRLDALCELIDEEIRNGWVGDDELAIYARRIAGNVDQVLSEDICWISDDDVI